MSHWNRDVAFEIRGQGISQGRYALALILIGASIVMIVGASLEELWIGQVAAADHDGGSTIPIPPPDRPTPKVIDNAPLTSPSGAVTATSESAPLTSPSGAVTATSESAPLTSPSGAVTATSESAPLKTQTSFGQPTTTTPVEVNTREPGSGNSVALWLGIGLGVVGLSGLAIGTFIIVSSPIRGSSA